VPNCDGATTSNWRSPGQVGLEQGQVAESTRNRFSFFAISCPPPSTAYWPGGRFKVARWSRLEHLPDASVDEGRTELASAVGTAQSVERSPIGDVVTKCSRDLLEVDPPNLIRQR
jgi:hypothetical protein